MKLRRPGSHLEVVSWLSTAAMALALSACGKPPMTGKRSVSGHTSLLVRGNGAEPDSLDPQRARSIEAHHILRDLCEGLTTLDHRANPAPGVASRWTVSADGRTYTFTLRPQARWSNGDRVVGLDFVAGLRRLVDPATASSYAQIIDAIGNAREIIAGRKPPDSLAVSAPSPDTVVIRLTAPTPYLVGLLAHPSTCPAHRPTLAISATELGKTGVWNGAFSLKEWVQGLHVLLERNRWYWNDAATRLDAVEWLHIPDEAAELMRYRAGDLQISATIPRSQIDWIKAHLPDQLHLSPQLNTYYYGFNLKRPPFGSVKLRRALSLVVDRERLAQVILRVGERPAYGWVPPGVHEYRAQSFDYSDTPIAKRITEARQLYAAAGYSRERPLQLELRFNAGEVHERLALAIASMWQHALGVEVRLQAVEFKSLLEDIDRESVEVFRSSWSADYNDAYSFLQVLRSDCGINLTHYQSAEYDALLARASGESNGLRRAEWLQQAEGVALRDHAVMPIYFYVNKRLVKPEVDGWYDNVLNVVYSKDLSIRSQQRVTH